MVYYSQQTGDDLPSRRIISMANKNEKNYDFEYFKHLRRDNYWVHYGLIPNKELDDETLMREYEVFIDSLDDQEVLEYTLDVLEWKKKNKI